MLATVRLAAMAALAAGCAGSRGAVRDDAPPAPLDAALAQVPGARALWIPDAEFGGTLYVVVVEPLGVVSAPPLFLVHGLGTAGLTDFYPVLPALARGRRVVTFDLPGFARSTGGNELYTPTRYAAVLSRLITRFGGGPVDVLGHSMGGAIALMHAATHPEQVRRLVLVDAAGVLHRQAWFGHHLRRVTEPASLLFPETVEQLEQLVGSVFRASRALEPLPALVLITPALRQQLLDGNPGRIAALSLILTDFSDAIAKVGAPTLVVWGGDDQVAPVRTGQLLADRVRGATLLVLDGVGHNVMAEAPARLLAAVEAHLVVAPGVGLLAALAADALPPPAAASHGDVTCNGQNDLRLTGTYGTVVLERCERAVLEGASLQHLVMRNSSADVLETSVAAGVVLTGSRLRVTGGHLDGEVALDLADSDADLAGVAIDARLQVYRLAGTSRAIFSVCPLRAGGHLHGVTDANGAVVGGGLL